jgi:hypothetical protein
VFKPHVKTRIAGRVFRQSTSVCLKKITIVLSNNWPTNYQRLLGSHLKLLPTGEHKIAVSEVEMELQ